jgi:hypothetical protein
MNLVVLVLEQLTETTFCFAYNSVLISPDQYTTGADYLSPLRFRTPFFSIDRLNTFRRQEEEIASRFCTIFI